MTNLIKSLSRILSREPLTIPQQKAAEILRNMPIAKREEKLSSGGIDGKEGVATVENTRYILDQLKTWNGKECYKRPGNDTRYTYRQAQTQAYFTLVNIGSQKVRQFCVLRREKNKYECKLMDTASVLASDMNYDNW